MPRPIQRWFAVAAAFVTLSCAVRHRPAYPAESHYQCTQVNIMPYLVHIWLQDERGTVQWMGYLHEGERMCLRRWPFPGRRGRWGYQADTEDIIRWDARWFESATP
jgi:hypothetical protein